MKRNPVMAVPLAVLLAAACVGDPPASADSIDSSDAGADAEKPSTVITSGGPGSSCTEPPHCVNKDLVRCNEVVTTCGDSGCVEEGPDTPTRCRVFSPTAPAMSADLLNEEVTKDLELGAQTTVDVTTGSITTNGASVRSATNPNLFLVSEGVGFEVRDVPNQVGRRAAVIVANDIVLSGSPTWTGTPAASQGLVLVARHSLRVTGVVSFPCGPALGGFAGATTEDKGGGGGGQSSATTDSFHNRGGGGGGGNATVGGAGGAFLYKQAVYPVQDYTVIAGGLGGSLSSRDLMGGGGGGASRMTASPGGGAGGAAVLLVAGSKIELGDSSSSAVRGLNVGGCGGLDGGGGGAGGWLGLDSPQIDALPHSGLAANGGGGGGATGAPGQSGILGTEPASGGPSGNTSGGGVVVAGGAGGTTTEPVVGVSFTQESPVSYFGGGGGGGSAGRIVIRSTLGAINLRPGAAGDTSSWFASPTPTFLGLQPE